MDRDDGLLFKDTIPTSTTLYVGLKVRNRGVGAFISWLDSTSAATITVELTSSPAGLAPSADGTAKDWKTGVTLVGPAASAAGSELLQLTDVTQKYARLKIVTTAVTKLEIWDGAP